MSENFATPTTIAADYKGRIAHAKSMGRGSRLVAAYRDAILAAYPGLVADNVAGTVHAFLTGCECPSGRGKTCTCGKREAVKDSQKRDTDYGTAHGSLVTAIKRALKDDSPSAPVMRVTLSGEGGGSTTVASDHPLYASLLALIAGENADENADDK